MDDLENLQCGIVVPEGQVLKAVIRGVSGLDRDALTLLSG
jgi:hypothetical protein